MVRSSRPYEPCGDDGFDGFFSLEPHLGDAHALGGFSGPQLFTQAWQAFTHLKRQEIAYA